MQEEKVTDLVCWAPFSFALLRSCYSANSFFSFCSVCVCLFLWFLLCFFFVFCFPVFCVGLPCFSLGLAPPFSVALSLSPAGSPSLFSSSFVCVCSLCLLGFLLAFVFLYALFLLCVLGFFLCFSGFLFSPAPFFSSSLPQFFLLSLREVAFAQLL